MNKTFQDFNIDIPGGSTGEIDTQCPECGPSRKKQNVKCLSVNTFKGVWKCHHCQWEGGVLEGEKNKSVPYSGAVEPKAFQKPTYPIEQPVNEDAVAFFEKRGIPLDVLQRNKIASGHMYIPQLEKRTFVVQFPYYRNGELVNVKYRAIEQKAFMMAKGAERIFFGLDDLGEPGEGDCVIIVEGEIDKLSFEVAGFLQVLSVPDGAPSTGSVNLAGKMSYLDSAANQLSQFKKFVIAVDGDGPGQTLQAELVRRLGPDLCFIVQWPDGCKDANDVLVKYGREVLAECIQDAKATPLAGVGMVQDYHDPLWTLYQDGMQPGCSTGWPMVDLYYTVKPGQLTIVTGIPGHGKSTWVDAVAVNLAENEGWKFAVFSPENYPVERHILALAQQYSGKSFYGDHRQSSEHLQRAEGFLHEHFFFLGQDEEHLQTVESLLKQAQSLVKRYGINGLIIDPFNEIDHTRDPSIPETEYISRCLTLFRLFGRKFGVHVWIIAHPTKLSRDKDGNYPIPNLYDISGSAHWRNKADNGIIVWREVSTDSVSVDIHVSKVRFREVGKVGAVRMRFDKTTGRYSSDYGQAEF